MRYSTVKRSASRLSSSIGRWPLGAKVLSPKESLKIVDRLMSHERKKKEGLEKARLEKIQEEEMQILALKKMHKSQLPKQGLKKCFQRLTLDAELRTQKLEEARKRKS